jgi:dephospho-CoA kinase
MSPTRASRSRTRSRRTARTPDPSGPEARPGAPPAVLGLTGGIGAGKSEALAAFARAGAAVLSSDGIVHRLYRDPEVRAAVAERFGQEMMAPDGSVDRARLGRRAFGDPEAVAFLEGLLHPRIRDARERWIATQRAADPAPSLLVCEVPLLFEAGLEGIFDAVVVITASEAVRRARVEERGQDFAARTAHQLPEAEKVSRADHVYVNDGSLDDLQAWVDDLHRRYSAEGAHARA